MQCVRATQGRLRDSRHRGHQGRQAEVQAGRPSSSDFSARFRQTYLRGYGANNSISRTNPRPYRDLPLRGIDLVPEEFAPTHTMPAMNAVSVSKEELDLITDVEKINREVDKTDAELEEAKTDYETAER